MAGKEEVGKNEEKSKYDDYSLKEVPKHSRYGFFNIFLVFSSVYGAIAVIWGGGALGYGLTFSQAVIAVLSGTLVLAVLGSLIASIGAYSGLSTYVMWRHPLGRLGGKIAGFLLISITTGIGWYAVETWLFGIVISEIFPNNPFFSVGVASIWGGILMIIMTYIGYRMLSFMSYFTIPFHIWLIGIGIAIVLSLKGGFTAVVSATPTHYMSLLDGISAIIGLYSAGTIISSDISRFSKSAKDAASAWISHIIFLYPFLILGGVAIVLVTGSYLITNAMLDLGMGVGVLLIIIFGQFIINTDNLYSGSLSLVNLYPMRREIASIINGIIGTAIAAFIGFIAGSSITPFEDFISLLGDFLPAMGGIVIADFFIVRKYFNKMNDPYKRYQFTPGNVYYNVNIAGVLALALGSIVGFFINLGIPAVNSLITGLLTYPLLYYLIKSLGKNPEILPYNYEGGDLK
ncbi:purine-cytosine permease family protein [Acidianus manzaensis]|uniref:Cytosine permease n=1 Tax=Acidianus manzaensis TaxID=282676 RepID=A0A1W6K3X9_9CREN|nr:cytosine permease [Acidianus manzaensis]ARM77210.1 cytosine permease [Acidianus manzaensis]